LLSPSKFISKKGEKLIGNGMKKFLLFAIFLVSLSFLISNAKAVTYISGCSDLDIEGETYYLTQDIINSSSSMCITIGNNITLDCQGHIIDGVNATNSYGIIINTQYGYDIIKNCILTDWTYGIFISSHSDYNILTNITSTSNTYGLYIYYGGVNTIVNDSKFQDNDCGVYVYRVYEPNYLFYNNLFNNTCNIDSYLSEGQIWNTTKRIGTRIYSAGTEIGGNYWTNPAGNGYSDTCVDDDKDGFCDLPYDTGLGIDYLPLSDEYVPPNLPPEIIIFSPLNQSYYGSIDFAFKAIDDLDKNFTVKAYLNNQLEYENLYYQNNTQISYSKTLPMGTYNFTVYAEDSYGNSSQQEVIFTSFGYCGDNICQADYENSANCFKDCGGASKNFVFLVVVGLGIMGIVFGRDLVAGTKTTEEMVRTFVVILIILVVIGIIASTWL
jgi:hypothetical protein